MDNHHKMHLTEAKSWSEFSDWLRLLESERGRMLNETRWSVSPLLFRGQSDASWKLTTTLERSYPNALDVCNYYRAAYGVKHQIEAYTERAWDVPNPPKYRDLVSQQVSLATAPLPALEYLTYLRHHGFPSPLLDWSVSPYIAAFFALDAPAPKAERIAIYAFIETTGNAKTTAPHIPSISTVGPYIRTHRRHFLQQSRYSFCVIKSGSSWHYADHESAFNANMGEDQDILWKFTLPASERALALQFLDKFNLNAFSLLGSEDSLMRTVAFREFDRQR